MEELIQLIESNAKAIAALTADVSEMKRDRQYLYGLMGDLTEKMGVLNSHQVRSYELIESLDARQQQITNQQQQLLDIQKSINKTLEKLSD